MAVSEQPVRSAESQSSLRAGGRRNGRWSAFLHLLMARLKELQREPEVIFWVFGFPILLALGLGIAFRNKPADVTAIAIVESAEAQNTVSALHSKNPAIHVQVEGRDAALEGLRLGKFDLVMDPDGKGGFVYRYDPSRPESVLSHAEVDDAVQAAAGRKDPLSTSVVTSSEPGSRYIDFLIPGLLGMNLMNSAMWGIGFGVVDMRQRKLLKRLVATPMRRSDFLLALMSSRIILMLVEVGLLLGFGMLAFHMRITGSLGTILLIGMISALSFGGIGLLTAARAQKLESISGLINVVMMPMWIFSGVFFSYERFPASVQPLIKLLPLTALNDALRATILQGATLSSQAGRIAILALWGGISFVLALKSFRWT